MDWAQRARTLETDTRAFVGGKRIESHGARQFESVNPHDGTIVASLPACGEDEIDAAVGSARSAFESGEWSRCSAHERGRVLVRLADTISANVDELALLDSLEMGMPITSARALIAEAAGLVRNVAEWIDKIAEELLPSGPDTLSFNLRVPHGVVGAITPWNVPLYMAVEKAAPALAMGNSVVLKPSEIASLSSLRLGDLATEAGLPPGVLNVLPGLGTQAGRALACHRDVDCLSFTGSTATGRLLMAYAGQSNLKALMMECGGKSPQLVFDDVSDLDSLAQALVQGFAWNSGQVCVAGSRILVTRTLYEPLVERMAKLVDQLKTAAPLDPSTELGPLASRAQLRRVQTLVDAARKDGAKVVAGGSPRVAIEGCHFQPTLFAGVAPDHPLMQEEIFGPVAGVLPFDGVEEALAIANGTRYGLSATVWTRDFGLGHGLARRLRGGPITINATAVPKPSFAVGVSVEPTGASGFGPIGGLAGLLAYARARNVTFNL